jgi:ATP-dependent helicase HrpB
MPLPLPIDPLLPELVRTLEGETSLVLEAPPGAGKTTRVPRALLDASADGEILVLEPRRLAARLAAKRVAEELGEELGGTVGYQVRFEDVSSARTRIRFVTEGILTRRLLADRELRGVSTVVLDEFHERHLHGDVALALLRRLQRSSRPDLRLVVMSATLDAGPIAAFLGARTLRAEGRRFDVAIDYLAAPDNRPLQSLVASAVRALVGGEKGGPLDGDVLVFLPGAAEIRRAREACEAIAREADLLLVPLHGDLTADEQDRAIRPAAKRKVILSTNVAESSVTIEGVVAVVDGGLARVAGHAAWSGLPTLRVEKISRASAAQRAGRAGRTRPGICVRLYTKADHDTRPEHDVAEIRRADLAQTRLELASHGVVARTLEWLEAPPEPALAAAEDLLGRLGAIEAAGNPTPTGDRMLAFPLHPRLARVMVEAEARGVLGDAAVLVALVAERDIRSSSRSAFRGPGARRDAATERSDLLAILDLFREAEEWRFSDGALRAIGLDAGATFAVDRARKQLVRVAKRARGEGTGVTADHESALLASILAGYPDRVAKRKRNGSRELAIAGGGIAELSEASLVREAEWLVAVDAERRDGLPHLHGPARSGGTFVRLASGIEPEWLIDLFPGSIAEKETTTWDDARERVEHSSRMTYEGLPLTESRTPGPFRGKVAAEAARVLADAALAAPARAFASSGADGAHGAASEGALDRWLARARFAATVGGPSAPAAANIRDAVIAECEGKSSFDELRARPLVQVLKDALGPAGVARVEALAPDAVRLTPSRSARVHYEEGKPPWIESHLQDFFGFTETPRVGKGQTSLVVHLLAPNRRAVQVTTDLAGFWERHYPTLRKELSRRYPRHKWPEDPRIPVPPTR